jgi:hypothetical protein
VPSGYILPSGNSSSRASLTRPAGVRPFAWPDIDSDDEEEQMFAEIFEEEMAAAAQDEEHMLILPCLSGLYTETAIGRRGGSAPGRRKCKPRQRMEDYCILYADYFADNSLHGEAIFRRRFRMSCNDPRFYQFLGEIFAFVLLEMIGISQGFKTFESI